MWDKYAQRYRIFLFPRQSLFLHTFWKKHSGNPENAKEVKILENEYLVDLKNCLLQGFFHDFGLIVFQNFELVEVKLCQGNKKKQCIFFSPKLGNKKKTKWSVNELVSMPQTLPGKKIRYLWLTTTKISKL